MKSENNFSGLDSGSGSFNCNTDPCLLGAFVQARFSTMNTGDWIVCTQEASNTNLGSGLAKL